VIIIDRRNDSWGDVKNLLLKINVSCRSYLPLYRIGFRILVRETFRSYFPFLLKHFLVTNILNIRLRPILVGSMLSTLFWNT